MKHLFERIGELLDAFARQIGGHDWEDVRSEMNVAIVEAGPGQKDAYYLCLAKWRGETFAKAFRNRREWARPMRVELRAVTIDFLDAVRPDFWHVTSRHYFTTLGTGKRKGYRYHRGLRIERLYPKADRKRRRRHGQRTR